MRMPVAGATADRSECQQQPSDATNIIKSPMTLEEKADTAESSEDDAARTEE